MKKSILALSTVAALGGLGFAGAAHAIAYFGAGPTTVAPAQSLQLHAAGTGHMLFTPYFSAQGNRITLLSLTNTDTVNGKAVKVRFRGAANSDDVFDFTLFLSPGDVWTGTVNTASESGPARLATADTSCTLPLKSQWNHEGSEYNQVFNTQRLLGGATAPAIGTREGYVEFLNMADIPPNLLVAGQGVVNAGVAAKDTNKLFTAIKHVSGVAPCTDSAFNDLITTDVITDGTVAGGYGLAAPTGGLTGSFAVVNRELGAAYGSAHTAVTATTLAATAGPAHGYLTPGSGLIAFAPQRAAAVDGTTVKKYTADPLLRSARLAPLWFDLPDMSTPLIQANVDNAIGQATALSNALAKTNIINEYAFGTSNGVAFDTDWVISQPTRRYHAAVQYTGTQAGVTFPAIVWNADMSSATSADTTTAPAATANRYAGLTMNAARSQACLTGGSSSFTDREERGIAGPGADFSPGVAVVNALCGEVALLRFSSGVNSPLGANITWTLATGMPAAGADGSSTGWGQYTFGGNSIATSLPVVGFAATSINAGGRNYGWTIPHRYTAPAQ